MNTVQRRRENEGNRRRIVARGQGEIKVEREELEFFLN